MHIVEGIVLPVCFMLYVIYYVLKGRNTVFFFGFVAAFYRQYRTYNVLSEHILRGWYISIQQEKRK